MSWWCCFVSFSSYSISSSSSSPALGAMIDVPDASVTVFPFFSVQMQYRFCRRFCRRVDASARLTLTLCHGFSLSPFFPFQHQALPGRHFRHWVPLHCSTSLVEDYGDQWSANSVHCVLTTTHHQAAFATVTEAGIGRIARRFAGQAVSLFLQGNGLPAASGS